MVSFPTVEPRASARSFLELPIVLDLDTLDADMAFLGVPYGSPYNIDEVANDQSRAPTAIRQASELISTGWERWDFDLGGTPLDGRPVRLVDCGDVPGSASDPSAHSRRAEEAVRRILAAGTIPIVFGGDHGITIPVLRAFEGRGPITIVQIDAHIDWRAEKFGEPEGYSSPMRRASEMAHVSGMYQIGLRGQGSAREEEVLAARAYGAILITSSEVHRHGADWVLEQIPSGGEVYLTIDADVFDPSVMPGVAGPVPGGLTFYQVQTILFGLVSKTRVLGMDIVEIAPQRDVGSISAITAGRLALSFIGAAVRAGYFDRGT